MFVTSSDYENVVKSISAEDGDLLAAVAFWGRGAELIFRPHSGQSVKLICNLASGATNPSVIEALRNINGVILRQHDSLHAKVVVGNKRALVGSANFSSNGLNFEGSELSGWEEAGLLTDDPHQIRDIREWFGALWDKSREIKDSDLDEARLKWKPRRATRPRMSPRSSCAFSLGSLSRADILDRQVYVAIYRSDATDEAKKAYRKYEENLSGQPTSEPDNLPAFYEAWKTLPKEAQLIDLYYGPRGALRCDGVFTRTHDVEFKYKNGQEGHLAVCRKEDHVMDYPFGKEEMVNFANDLRPYIEMIWNSKLAKGDESGKCIRLSDVANICG
jgi:hypothetical protein